MKALVNPLLLLLCIVLLACGSLAPEPEGIWDFLPCVLGLCATAFCVNAVLALSRALSRRPALVGVMWAVIFVIFGSVAWVLAPAEEDGSVTAQERQVLRERVRDWRAGADAYAVDANGDSLLLLAAGLGREDVLTKLLADREALAAHAAHYALAAQRAAERNRMGCLRLLLEAGVSPNALAEGQAPLHAAASNRARRVAVFLLERGADANVADEEGLTPLHRAVVADDAPMVAILLQRGADPKRVDGAGRDAASYARSEAVEAALRGEEVAR